jgi:hypothetical protein
MTIGDEQRRALQRKEHRRKAWTMSTMICTQCGTISNSKTVTRGSFLIEIVLWLCFVVPGLLYTMWRLTTRSKACTACGATTLVPVHSPVGRKLRSELAQAVPCPASPVPEERPATAKAQQEERLYFVSAETGVMATTYNQLGPFRDVRDAMAKVQLHHPYLVQVAAADPDHDLLALHDQKSGARLVLRRQAPVAG